MAGNATGAAPSLSLSGMAGVATGAAVASALAPSISLSVPIGSATGAVAVSATAPAISLTAPPAGRRVLAIPANTASGPPGQALRLPVFPEVATGAAVASAATASISLSRSGRYCHWGGIRVCTGSSDIAVGSTRDGEFSPGKVASGSGARRYRWGSTAGAASGVTPVPPPILKQAIVAALLAETNLTAILGSNVFPVVIPESTNLANSAALTYKFISSLHATKLVGAAGMQSVRVRFRVSSFTHIDVETIKEIVRNLMQGYSTTLQGLPIVFVTFENEVDGYDELYSRR